MVVVGWHECSSWSGSLMSILERKNSLASVITFPSLKLALGGAHPHRSAKRMRFLPFILSSPRPIASVRKRTSLVLSFQTQLIMIFIKTMTFKRFWSERSSIWARSRPEWKSNSELRHYKYKQYYNWSTKLKRVSLEKGGSFGIIEITETCMPDYGYQF